MTDSANTEAETDETTTPEAPELQALRDDFEKFKDLYVRSQADLDNYRKRAAREIEDARRYANLSLLERLLPVLDNFELGLDAARQSGGSEGILQGMSMVQKQLQDFLRESGVEAIEAVGTTFDPNIHEALGQEPSDEAAEGIVTRQLRRGYKLKDRLLRPSAVMVSKGPAAE
ncbi:MAG TPA: nucleotide exchange factor GrpE [Chthoniobacterales bacterium]|nr:nucleotide exchange factor GrpE [Chthoniobacterales bacterium]